MNCLNRHRFASILTRLAGWVLAPILLFAWRPVPGKAADDPGPAARSTITSLAQLRRAATAEQSVVVALKVEGTVWWGDARHGTLILHDTSGTDLLGLDLPCRMPRAGDRLKLEGDCAVAPTTDGIKLTSIPVVDNDGLHAAVEKSASIHLETGFHPIRVAWFNRTDKSELELQYEGPGLARRKVPDSALFPVHAELLQNLIN